VEQPEPRSEGGSEAVGGQAAAAGDGADPLRHYLLRLERVLAGRSKLIEAISSGVEEARAKLDHFSLLHSNLLAHLADIYSRTISQLPPRIMVQGDPHFLQLPDNQNRIRALLLAGVRSAWLWRQVGGSRWKILFGRRELLLAARDYLGLAQH